MDERRIDLATNRIQGALDRIEKASLAAIETRPAAAASSGDHAARVRRALEQLDDLIASLEG